MNATVKTGTGNAFPSWFRGRRRRTSVASPVSITRGESRVFRYFLMGTVALSIGAACIENGLHPLVLLTLPVVIAALSRKDYSRPYLWSETATTVAFILYAVIVSFAIMITVRRIPLPLLLVYFTFGTVLARVLSPLNDRNLAQLIFLTAGLVLINCILTNRLLFGLVLPAYLFCLMCTLALFDLARGRRAAKESVEAVDARPTSTLCRSLGKITVAILAFGAITFVLLPRPFLVMPGLRSAMSSPSGLADLEKRVSYRDMVNMAGRERIAFAVRVEYGTLPDYPYWRGRVLDKSDGKGWFGSTERKGIPRIIHPRPEEVVVYEFIPYKLQSKTVYACGFPLSASGGTVRRRLYVTADGEVFVDSPFLFATSYTVTSVKRHLPVNRRQIRRNLDTEGITPRIEKLAQDWTRGLTSPADKAEAIISRFKSRFRYTLDTPTRPEGTDPLDYFLFESRAGHCEYFAGAYCLMLRSLGIPARVVEGFAGKEPTDEPDRYVVRFAQAHAWVEAMLDDATWTPLDPTPPARDLVGGRMWQKLMDFLDTWENRWTKYVVYFDRSDQSAIFGTLGGLVAGEVLLPQWLAERVGLLPWVIVIGGVLFITALLVAHRFRRQGRDLSHLYVRTMRDLVSRGALTQVHSWHELNVTEVGSRLPRSKDAMTRFMQIYYRRRFGQDGTISEHDLARARGELIKVVEESRTASS